MGRCDKSARIAKVVAAVESGRFKNYTTAADFFECDPMSVSKRIRGVTHSLERLTLFTDVARLVPPVRPTPGLRWPELRILYFRQPISICQSLERDLCLLNWVLWYERPTRAAKTKLSSAFNSQLGERSLPETV
jgi:hypothetical protein